MMYSKNDFDMVLQNVKHTANQVDCTGTGVMIIQKGKITLEEYWGKQSRELNSRPIQQNTQFHVASVRKSYIGFAVAYAIHYRYISSINEPITAYLPKCAGDIYNGISIRHLLTHTHGLRKINNEVIREFEPGTLWAYTGVGIELLTQIVKKATGQDIAAILQDTIFKPLQLTETGWYGEMQNNFVEVIRSADDPAWYTSEITDGSQMNMYVSVRDLAAWGQLHLNLGKWNDQQIVNEEIIRMATVLQTPETLPTNLPQNGFLWFVQKKEGLESDRMEISLDIPTGSYQILGYTGVTLLVIPQFEVVAVRAFNSFGSPPGFDYLEDIRNFGSSVMQCLRIR